MKGNKHISDNTIRRMPKYLRLLRYLKMNGTMRISSAEIGEKLNFTSSQVRQDFSTFGSFGQQGFGYEIDQLISNIEEILGTDSRKRNTIFVGVGKLGAALITGFDFEGNGFKPLAGFDLAPGKYSETLPIPVMDDSLMDDFIRKNQVEVAVLCVPKNVAHRAADRLEKAGIKALWNFTNIDLGISNSKLVVENVHLADSLLAMSFYLKNQES